MIHVDIFYPEKLISIDSPVHIFTLVPKYWSTTIMSSFDPAQEQTLSAFITALSQQTESLPPALQAQLQSIGQDLANRVMELRVVAASIPSLDKAYRETLVSLRTNEDEAATGVTFVSSTAQHQTTQLTDNAVQILTAPDSVEAAQHRLSRNAGQITSKPLRRFFRRG